MEGVETPWGISWSVWGKSLTLKLKTNALVFIAACWHWYGRREEEEEEERGGKGEEEVKEWE